MRTTAAWIGIGLAVVAAGCAGADGAGNEPTGSAVARLTNVPNGVQCARITARGVTIPYALMTGAASTLDLGPQPSGTMLVSAQAFNVACDGINAMTPPTWVSDPTSVTITAGLTTSFAITLRPNASTNASLDFVQPAVDVAARSDSTYAVMVDGTVRAWGRNDRGQLGDGTTTDRSVPVTVMVDGSTALTDVRQVVAGSRFACALTNGGAVSCWGDNASGQLAGRVSDAMYAYASPILAPIGGAVTFQQIAAGDSHACGLATNGNLYCWGSNLSGQLGVGDATPLRFQPTLASGASGASEVRAGATYTCVRLHDATITCAGYDNEGVIGNGTCCPFSNSFTLTTAYSAVASFAAGESVMCALTPTGGVRCSGYRLYHGSFAPESIVGLSDITGLAVGFDHLCARRLDGTVWCFGLNGTGQLGDGSNVDEQTTVVQVIGLTTARRVAVGTLHSCAVLSDGTVSCWGRNNYGQLGDGTLDTRFTPARVRL